MFTCDVVLVDQFGEPHTAKDIEFQPMGGQAWDAMRKQKRSKQLQEIAEQAVKRVKNGA